MSNPLELTYFFPVYGFTLVLPIFGGTASSIDWGDGSPPTTDDTRTHTYSLAGTYNVSILGTSITQFNYFFDSGATGKEYLTKCTSFGEIGLTELYFSFYSTTFLTTVPSSLPTTSTITSMRGLFQYAGVNTDYTSITGWDVSGVQDMQAAFYGSNMNVDISGWDVSSVNTMRFMFAGNSVFNQPLNGWGNKTSNVVIMENMFSETTSFNQPIGDWDVSSVQSMQNMFGSATSFNQDLSNWQVSSLVSANGMFASATVFNNGGDIGTSTNPLSWGTSTSNITSISNMFSNAINFNQDISDWDVSKVTNVRTMFAFNTAFDQNLNSWNLTSLSDATLMFYGAFGYNNGGVTLDWSGKTPLLNNMDGMFTSATSFNQIILLDTSNVTNMGGLFYSAQVFNQDISGWDFSSVTNVNSMFAYSLYNHDVSNWNLTSLTSMQYMFIRAFSFNNGDVPFTFISGKFLDNISNITNMRAMFYEATSFNQDISNWNVSNVTDMHEMFNGATAFNNNNVTLNWDSKTSNVTNMQSMFSGATIFNSDISNWDVSSVTNMYGMFYGVTLFDVDISNWDVSNVTDMRAMFYNATSFNNGGVDLDWGLKTSTVLYVENMFKNASSFNQRIDDWDVTSIQNMASMFSGATVFNQPLNNWGDKTSNVTDMSFMFQNATSFNQPIGSWNVSSVGDMTRMFDGAILFNQNISGWDVSSVESMSSMFSTATAFNQNVSSWDVSNVYDMSGMFYNATDFNNGDTPSSSNNSITWGSKTSNVSEMGYMFMYATSFNQNISSWDTSSVNSMNSMFNGATAFNQPLGSWNVSNVINFGNVLYNTFSFNRDISSWNISKTDGINDMLSYSFLSTANYNKVLNYWATLTYTGESEGFYFGGYGLVYSDVSSDAHYALTQLPSPYNWIFAGDAYVSENIIKITIPFNLTINSPMANPETETTYFQSGDYQLYYLGEPFSSVVTYDNTVDNVIDFTNLVFSTTGYNLPIVLKRTTVGGSFGESVNIATYYLNAYPNTIVCFKEDTKILTDKGYIPIQDLRNGDMVKTLSNDYKPIFMIGKREIYHSALEERIKDQLYKCTKDNYPEIFEDLIITGCHSVLVDNFKGEQRENTSKLLGKIFSTGKKYRLPVCLDEKALVYEKEGVYTVYHLALENENYTWNYGIYANGLLVESCSKRYLKEMSSMTIIE